MATLAKKKASNPGPKPPSQATAGIATIRSMMCAGWTREAVT